MIRYQITEQDLLDRIEAEVPGWLERRRRATDKFVEKGKYDETASILERGQARLHVAPVRQMHLLRTTAGES